MIETINVYLNSILSLFGEAEFLYALFFGASPAWMRLLNSYISKKLELQSMENALIDERIMKDKREIEKLLSYWRLDLYDRMCELIDGEGLSVSDIEFRVGSGRSTYSVDVLLEKTDRKFDDMIRDELIESILSNFDEFKYWNLSNPSFDDEIDDFSKTLKRDMRVTMSKKVGRSLVMLGAIDDSVSFDVIQDGMKDLYRKLVRKRVELHNAIQNLKKLLRKRRATLDEKIGVRTKHYLKGESWKYGK